MDFIIFLLWGIPSAIIVFFIVIWIKINTIKSMLQDIKNEIIPKAQELKREEFKEQYTTLQTPIIKKDIEEKTSSLDDNLENIKNQYQPKETHVDIEDTQILDEFKTNYINISSDSHTTKADFEYPTKPTIIDKLISKLKTISFEELIFNNIILKIGIVAFILGVGLFLKYSVDHNWIPVWLRVVMGLATGMAMLIGGVKMIHNKQKLFSESLFGGGIAVLYLSIFSGFALVDLLDMKYAFVGMFVITILAGVISVRFDAKSTAIFGLIGGFATPFLINSGSGNVVGLLSYMLMLNFGVLFISYYKKWTILNYMSFGITAITCAGTIFMPKSDFVSFSIIFAIFFVIYSIIPFLNDIKDKRSTLSMPLVLLFSANFISVLANYVLLFMKNDIEVKYFAIVSIVVAAYLLLYSIFLSRKNLFFKNLFFIILSQAVGLLLITPVFLFGEGSLTIVWAVESLLLLWIGIKTKENTFSIFAFIGLAFTSLRFLSVDMSGYSFFHYIHYDDMGYHISRLKSLAFTAIFVFGSLFGSYKLLSSSHISIKLISSDILKLVIFIASFVFAFGMSNFLIHHLFYTLHISYFSFIFIALIGLFSYLLSVSEYAQKIKVFFEIFIALLGIGFILNIFSISTTNYIIPFIYLLCSGGIGYYLYTIIANHTSSNIKFKNLILIAGTILLFIFLNVEIYHIAYLISPYASKVAITLLWVIFGIVMFIFGIKHHIKNLRIVATILIFIAILKAFLHDLSHMDSIFKIILFLILGIILFGLSYFYQRQNNKEIS